MGSFIQYVRKRFLKTNISYPLIRTRMYPYQGVRNVSFQENFSYVLNERSPFSFSFVYLKQPPRCFVKSVLKNSYNSQKSTCVGVSFIIKLQAYVEPSCKCKKIFFFYISTMLLRRSTILKKRLRHRCFPVNIMKFLKHLFL